MALVVCLVVASLAAAPSHALEGRVAWKDGSPVGSAEVSVLGRAGSVLTNSEGRFVLKPDPTLPFELLVLLPGGGYAKPVFVAALPSEGFLTIEVSPVHAETVTVMAGGAPNVDAPPASGATLLTGAEIATRQPATLTQLLENVAGVSSVSEGQAAVPAVRGLARGRTLILIDGARVTSERRVGPSASYLDPFLLEGVEVVRGSGSVAYGSDALGGVIHARTRRAQPGAPLGGRLVGGLGAGVPEQRAGLELSKGFDNGGLLVQGHYRKFEDYLGPDGEVFNSGSRDYGFVARGDDKLGAGSLSLGLQSDFGRDVGRPRSNSRTVRFYSPREDSHRATARYELGPMAGWSRMGLTGFLGSYSVVTDQDRFPTASEARSIERADVAAKDFHVRATADRFAGSAKLGFGLDVNGRFGLEALDIGEAYSLEGTLLRRTENVSVDDAHRTDYGAFAHVFATLARGLTGTVGVRADSVRTRNSGGYFGDRSTDNGTVSGYAALTAGPFGGVSVTGQLSRGFRDPVLSDRYFRGPSGRGFITGNPDLRAETSLQYEGALRYTSSRWRIAAHGFHYRIDDVIERYQTQTDFFFFRNRGRARVRGVELEAQASLPGRFSIEVAAHLMQGEVLDDGTRLDDVPPETITFRLRKDFGEKGYVLLRGAAYGDDDRPGPSEVRVAGYSLLDATAGYRFNKKIEIQLAGRNLLDRSYLVSPDVRAVQAPGISVLATALITF